MSESGHNNERTNWVKYFYGRPDVLAAILSAVATILLVIVGVWGVVETSRALELSERAWISVSAITVTQTPDVNQPIRFAVGYNNSGKEPARDINFVFDQGVIEAPVNMDMTQLSGLPENKTCDTFKPAQGVFVAAPSGGTGGQVQYTHSGHTGMGAHPIYADEGMMDGKHMLFVQGCAAYTTFDKPHHTAFCFLLFITRTLVPPPVQQPAAVAPSQTPQTASLTPAVPAPVPTPVTTPPAPTYNVRTEYTFCNSGTWAD